MPDPTGRDCSECGKSAVTRDGRDLCLKCLRRAIAKAVPMIGCFPRPRGGEQVEDTRETKFGTDR